MTKSHVPFEAGLSVIVGAARVASNVPLARFTTLRVGGPADWFVEPASADETVALVRCAFEAAVPVTVLGGGSNVLIGDRGIRGLVLRPRGGAIAAEGDCNVRAEAAVTINGLVRWTISHGFSGLEAWAGTPGTVGGAVHGNAHFGGRLIGEYVACATLVAPDGTTRILGQRELEFGYDASRLQHTGELLLSAVFELRPGADTAVLRDVARQSLAHRKRTQPLDVHTAGCMFQNPARSEALPEGIPRSAGALIDRAGLKGHRFGGAVVSPVHANFIVNDGQATAADIMALATLCRERVREQFGVELRDEIVCLGEF